MKHHCNIEDHEWVPNPESDSGTSCQVCGCDFEDAVEIQTRKDFAEVPWESEDVMDE